MKGVVQKTHFINELHEFDEKCIVAMSNGGTSS